MTMINDPVAGQPAPPPAPPAVPQTSALATTDPVQGAIAPPDAVDPIAGQSAPLSVRAPTTPNEYRQRITDPATTYTVKRRTGYAWGAQDSDTPLTFQQMYERFVPADVQQRVQVSQNVATRAFESQDPAARDKQFQADRLQHDLTKQYVSQVDPTAFPEDDAQLRGQLTDLYKTNPAAGTAVTGIDQAIEGITHNTLQLIPLDKLVNAMQGLPEKYWNRQQIINDLHHEIQTQVNPTTSSVSRVAGNVVSPESLATGGVAGEVGGAVRAAGAVPIVERAVVHAIQAAGQSAALAGTENRLPTADEIATNAAGGLVAGAASGAASRVLPFAQRAAESAVAGNLPGFVGNKTAEISSSALAGASALVAANAAAAAAKGQEYSIEDAKRDFAMGVTLEPVARAHQALAHPSGPAAVFKDEATARKFVADNPNTTYVPLEGPGGGTVHAAIPVPDGSRTPERIEESAQQIARTQEHIRRQTGDSSITLTPVENPDVGTFGRMLGDRLGLKVHWYQSSKPLSEGSPSAVYLGGGHVAVDVGADAGGRDPVEDIPHEFIHDLRRTAPDIYQDIATIAERVAPNRLAQVRGEYADRYQKVLGKQLPAGVGDEEGVADFVKSMMTTPEKWDYLTRRQPTLADKLGAFVRDKLGVAPYSEPRQSRVETAGERIRDLVPGETDQPAAAGTASPSLGISAEPQNIRGENPNISKPGEVIPGGPVTPTPPETSPPPTPSPKRWTSERIENALRKAYQEHTGDDGGADDVVLHPDQLDTLSPQEKSKVSRFADEDEWTNRTASMSTGQAARFSDVMLQRALDAAPAEDPERVFRDAYRRARKAGQNDAEAKVAGDAAVGEYKQKRARTAGGSGQLDRAMEWAKGHDDPAVQFMAWMHENRAGTRKQLIDLTSPEKVEELLGKTFTINKEPFHLQVDEQGIVHLVDSDVEFPGADRIGDGHVPIDQGSIKDQLAATPPAKTRKTVDLSGLPEYLREEIQRQYDVAQKAGVVDLIERSAMERKTATQTAVELGDKLPGTQQDRKDIIRAVRSNLGIPSLDDRSEFEAWLKAKNGPSDEPPFSLFRKREEGGGDTQLSLAGESGGRETVGGTGSLFGDVRGKSPGVRDSVTNAPREVDPAALEKFGLTGADVDAARAHSPGEPSPAFAYGSKRARSGLGMKSVEGMTRAEAGEAHAGWKATREGMSQLGREAAENPSGLKPEELAERRRIEAKQTGESGVLFSLAGANSIDKLPAAERQLARDNFDAARAMVNVGKSDEETRLATGWFRSGYDGKWRYELDDSGMRFRVDPSEWADFRELGGITRPLRLGEMVVHPKFFEHYPELKDVGIGFTQNLGARGRALVGETPAKSFIEIDTDNPDPRRTVLHEMQHLVQDREGFAKGSNPEFEEHAGKEEVAQAKRDFALYTDAADAKRIADRGGLDLYRDNARITEELEKQWAEEHTALSGWQTSDGSPTPPRERGPIHMADVFAVAQRYTAKQLGDLATRAFNRQINQGGMSRYYRSAGEIEARDTAARADLTPDQRRGAPPAGVGPTAHDAIVRFSLASKDDLEKPSVVARLTAATRGALRDIRDNMDLDPLPRMTRMGGADEGASHAFARPAAAFITRDLVAKIFPTQYQDPAAMTRTWEALNADRLLGMYDEFKARSKAKREAAAALAKEPVTVPGANDDKIGNLSRSATEYLTKANAIDQKHSVAKLEATWREAMADPERAANIERWNKIGAPMVDGLYNELKALDSDAPQPPRGRNSAGVSLVSTDHDLFDFGAGELGTGEPDAKQPAGGTLRNAKVSKDRWDQSATGLGEYDTNPENVLGKIIGSRWNQVTKLRLFDKLQKTGGGVINDLPPTVTEDGKPVVFRRLDITQPKTEENGFTRMVPKTMWVRPEIYREVRDVLNTDLAPPSSPVFRALTRIQLLQVADAITHTKNLHSVLASALGGGSAWRDIARKVPGLATGDAVQEWVRTWRQLVSDSPEIRDELAGMARAGLLRPDFPATGIQKITKMQDFLHHADTAGRVILNRRWDNLVARGVVNDSAAGRRNFVGQLGNYNRRLMNPMARIFKDLGLSPFITAGQTFNRQSRRLVTGDPGFEAASRGAALRARAVNLGGVILAMGLVPGLVNTATTGNPLGRTGTPLGAIDTGTDDDKGGHRIFDYLQLMGMRRGLRSLGLDAIANGLLQGKDWNTIGGQAVQDVTQAALHPWVGPGVGFGAAALTGRRLDTRGKMEAQVVPEGGFKQNAENLRAAVASQNPLLYNTGRAILSGADKLAGGEGTGQTAGADLADVGGALLKSPEGAFGVKSVRPGTDAAQDAAARLGASHFPDEGPGGGGGAKAAAIVKLAAALRAGDEGAAEQLHQAIADGTISEKDVPRIIDRSSMSDLEWKVSHMSGKEAATVYAAGTADERSQIRDAVVARVARDNTISSEERGKLLQGIAGEEGVGTSMAEAKLVTELADLRSQDHADRTIRQRIQALSRQIGQASAAGDGGRAQHLRQQRQSLVSAARGSHVARGRLKRLGALAGRVSKIRKQVARGSLAKHVGAGKIRQTLAAVH